MKRFLPFRLNFACLCIFVSISASVTSNNKLMINYVQENIVPDSASLVFHELMFEQADSAAEYIEIMNRTKEPIVLNQIAAVTRKSDGGYNKFLKFPEGFRLDSMQVLAISSDTFLLKKHHDCIADIRVFQPSWSSLNNTAATLVLLHTGSGKILDEVKYSSDWHHPLLAEVKGVALEKIHPDLPSDEKSSWHSAATACGYGTPGLPNSQTVRWINNKDSAEQVWVEPQAFSPNGDGSQDYCYVKYHLPASGYLGKLTLFNLKGENIKSFEETEILSTEGFFVWDGTDDEKRRVSPGIYVAYIEIFHPLKGKMQRFTFPVVISLF